MGQSELNPAGRHGDLSSLHVTSLYQSYFFIRRINYMRYNNIIVILIADWSWGIPSRKSDVYIMCYVPLIATNITAMASTRHKRLLPDIRIGYASGGSRWFTAML